MGRGHSPPALTHLLGWVGAQAREPCNHRPQSQVAGECGQNSPWDASETTGCHLPLLRTCTHVLPPPPPRPGRTDTQAASPGRCRSQLPPGSGQTPQTAPGYWPCTPRPDPPERSARSLEGRRQRQHWRPSAHPPGLHSSSGTPRPLQRPRAGHRHPRTTQQAAVGHSLQQRLHPRWNPSSGAGMELPARPMDFLTHTQKRVLPA